MQALYRLKSLRAICTGLLLTAFVACEDDSNDNDDVPQQNLGDLFDIEEADVAGQPSADGQKIVYLTRRNEGISQVVTVDLSVEDAAQQQSVIEVASADSEHADVALSPDGNLIAYTEKGATNRILVRAFSGTEAVDITAGLSNLTAFGNLEFASDSQFLSFSAVALDASGQREGQQVFVSAITLTAGVPSAVISEGRRGQKAFVVIKDSTNYLVNFRSKDGDQQADVESVTFTLTGNTFSFAESAVVQESPDRLLNRPAHADPAGIYFVNSLDEREFRQRSGQQVIVGEELEENFAKMGISEKLVSRSLTSNAALTTLDFAGYTDQLPGTINAVSSTADGKYLLLTVIDYFWCEYKLTDDSQDPPIVTQTAPYIFQGGKFILVNTSTSKAFPLIMKKERGLPAPFVHSGVVQDPCREFAAPKSYPNSEEVDEQASISDPDMTISDGQITEVEAGKFVIIFNSRLTNDSDVMRMEISIPNIDATTIEAGGLEIPAESVVITSLSEEES